jgi:hypothetical protein
MAPFAIAITLLVVAIGIPTLANGGDRGELLDASATSSPKSSPLHQLRGDRPLLGSPITSSSG